MDLIVTLLIFAIDYFRLAVVLQNKQLGLTCQSSRKQATLNKKQVERYAKTVN
jgi:hypothetical protein